MNFTELYQRIRSIDEGTAPEPTAPGGVIKTKNADGTFSYKPKVPGERLSATLPGNQSAKTTDKTDNTKKQPTPANESIEECGDMPMGMMGMSSHQGQQDSVTMNISMNGSGAGGIRDLMSILRDIEGSDNADVHSHDVSKLFGGDDIEVAFDEEMDGGFGSATTAPSTATAGIDAVTATGNDLASKGIEAPKVNGGGNPMHEALTSRLHQMYQEIKEAKAIDPVRSADVQQIPHKIKPQANRPGLAPGGDPKLWDIQFALQKRGYKLKVDGLNGPATEKAAKDAGIVKDVNQNMANPSAASGGYDIGHTIGSGIGWIETAWRNLKQGFSAGQAGLEESKKKTMSRAAKGYEKYGKKGMQSLAKAGKEGKDLDKIRDKYNKYD
jgi:hypothetical protein